MCDLSVIIVNWNTRDLLKKCLKSIIKNISGMSYEIIVVDNNSSDGSCQMVEREFPQVRLIRNKENLGFARANNQAIKRSQGKYILLLNPDTIVLNRALNKMVEFMNAHLQIGALGARLLNPNGTLHPSCRRFPTLATAFFENTFLDRLFPRNRIIGRYKMGYWDHDDIREVDQPMGACLMVRRKTIDQIGLLDEQFYMYYEEVDWCYRIKKAGWKIYFIPQAQIIHYAGQSVAVADIGGILVEYRRSMYKFYSKHFKNKVILVILKGLIILGAILRVGVFFILQLTSHKKRKIR